jgi:hypothetical protein
MKQSLLVLAALLGLLVATACSTETPPPPTTPTPTLAPGKGRVVGVLKVRVGDASRPVKGAILYLGEVLKDNAGQEAVAGVDRAHSPQTITDEQGRFVFSNVPPGRYGLFFDNIKVLLILFAPDTGNAMIVQASAGEQTDMGTLVYDSLPFPPGVGPYP